MCHHQGHARTVAISQDIQHDPLTRSPEDSGADIGQPAAKRQGHCGGDIGNPLY